VDSRGLIELGVPEKGKKVNFFFMMMKCPFLAKPIFGGITKKFVYDKFGKVVLVATMNSECGHD